MRVSGLEDTQAVFFFLSNSLRDNDHFVWYSICDLTSDCLSFVCGEKRLTGLFCSQLRWREALSFSSVKNSPCKVRWLRFLSIFHIKDLLMSMERRRNPFCKKIAILHHYVGILNTGKLSKNEQSTLFPYSQWTRLPFLMTSQGSCSNLLN